MRISDWSSDVCSSDLTAEGLDSRFPIRELAVMGFFEVLPHLFGIVRRLRETVAAVKALRPDAVVTIDSPSFTLRIARRLKGQGIPLIHYVAPQVWAWKPWRAKEIAGTLDRLDRKSTRLNSSH